VITNVGDFERRRSRTMAALKEMRCEACHAGAPRVTPDELERYLEEVPEWALQDQDGIARLARVFEFPDFATALAFTNAVGPKSSKCTASE
jgi:4a-hydroxytetrahydrobiopterin dehydratase